MRVLAALDSGDGAGPVLFAAGPFTMAGGVAVSGIATWNGACWSPFETRMDGPVHALATFDDGSGGGPALYAGGEFTTAGGVVANSIAKWDGRSWSSLGTGMNSFVLDLAVFDDGSGGGPALIASGFFTTAGGAAANRIARWDGTGWAPLTTGMNFPVRALTVFDDGNGAGPALYAGGDFTVAGGTSAPRIAKWDGTAWSPLGAGIGGLTSRVRTLAVFDDGTGHGDALYVGGSFIMAGGTTANYIARWDGTAWSPLGNGMNFEVSALAVFDDASGARPALFAGGAFTLASGVAANRVAKWDGANWSALGAGADQRVSALAVFDDGLGGRELYAGGDFDSVDGALANSIASWNGAEWSPVGNGLNKEVSTFTVFDDELGGGPALYAGGAFEFAGGSRMNRIAKWDGTAWSSLGSGMNLPVGALEVFDGGGGPALYVGGRFATASGVPVNHIARWDGSAWSGLGGGTSDNVHALAVFDDGSGGGPALYAGGNFLAAGGLMARHVARWDGASWSSLGSGTNAAVLVLAVFSDGGSRPALYAGGLFTSAGGVTANCIARWDGTSWSSLGNGTNGPVRALKVFDDGSGGGPSLQIGGDFTIADDMLAARVARWNGTSWSALGSGVNLSVRALTVFDDGSGAGQALYAGGRFTKAGGGTAQRIARWDGASWSPLGGGMHNKAVSALAVFDDGGGAGRALYAGGTFERVVDSTDSFLGKWGRRAPPTPLAYCTGKTNSLGCVPFITTTGSPSASSASPFRITANDVIAGNPGMLLYGFRKANLNFHGGKQCIKAPLTRLLPFVLAKSAGSPPCTGVLNTNFNSRIQNSSSLMLTTGQTVFAQWYQSEPADPSGFGDGLSNAVRFTIRP